MTPPADTAAPTAAGLAGWPAPARPAAPPDAALEARIDALLAGMTLVQKVGQMTQPDIRWITPDEVRHNQQVQDVYLGGHDAAASSHP